MRRWTYLVSTALVFGSIAAMAAGDGGQPYPACTTKPSEPDQKAAKSLFTAGQVSFNEADYRTAITYWRDSYRRDCTANLLLLNLARAYELAGNKREAVIALKTYIERQPGAPDAPQIQRRIENLEKELGGPAPTAQPPVTPTAPAPTTPAISAPPPPPAGSAAPTSAPAQETSPPQLSGPRKSIAPWIVVGVGGAVTLVGLGLYADGKSKVNDAEASCPNRSCPPTSAGLAAQDEGTSGRKGMTTGGVLIGLGLVGVASGLVWQFVSNKPRQSPAVAGAPSIGPSLGPGYSGLSVNGQF